jgi:hypothetical protein
MTDRLWATWSHRCALLVGLLVSFWASVETPAERSFELTMRRLDLTGAILGPFDLAWTVTATLALSLVAYAVAWLALRLVYRMAFAGGAEPGDPAG